MRDTKAFVGVMLCMVLWGVVLQMREVLAFMHAIALHIIASLMAIGLTQDTAFGWEFGIAFAVGLIPPLVPVCLYVGLLLA
jgi:hypothetical protein